MQSKGQLTIFLLVGIVLITIILIGSFVREERAESKEIRALTQDPTASLQKYVQTCLKQVTLEGAYFISLQGGYNNPPLASTAVLNVQIPHYWSLSRKMMPEPARIEEEIDDYIEQNMPKCLQDFSVFEEQGFSISSDRPIAHSILTEENVIITLQYPVEVLKGDARFSLNEFSAIVDVPIGKAYGYASMILDEQQQTPDLVPIGYIAVLAKERGFKFEIINYDEDSVIISLIFEGIPEKNYLFTFMSKYDWEGKDE